MSYCKDNKGSDFYIWRNASGVYCVMSKDEPVRTITNPNQMLEFVMRRYLAGGLVPLYTIKNLIDDVINDGKCY